MLNFLSLIKNNDREFPAPIKSTGGERYFYEIKEEHEKYSIEEKLGVYEAVTAPVICKIIANGSIKSLTRKEKMILSKFIALQFLRGPAVRNRLKELIELLELQFNFFEEFGIHKPTEHDNKKDHCEIILNGVNKFSPYLYNKDWVLCESHNASLIIGDNPVVMHNTFNEGLGLKTEGVEIYLPISPRYSLLILCGSVRKRISESLSRDTKHPSTKPHIKNLKNYAHTFKRKGLLNMNSENIKFLNSLQIINSERFLYSHEMKFDLPKLMISENGELRTGTGRFEVAMI